MNHHIDPTKVAFTVGTFIGGWHVVWSALIAFGFAQTLINFVLWMHMINVPYVVKAFDFYASVTLVLVTWFFGCILGYVFARIWNRMHRSVEE